MAVVFAGFLPERSLGGWAIFPAKVSADGGEAGAPASACKKLAPGHAPDPDLDPAELCPGGVPSEGTKIEPGLPAAGDAQQDDEDAAAYGPAKGTAPQLKAAGAAVAKFAFVAELAQQGQVAKIYGESQAAPSDVAQGVGTKSVAWSSIGKPIPGAPVPKHRFSSIEELPKPPQDPACKSPAAVWRQGKGEVLDRVLAVVEQSGVACLPQWAWRDSLLHFRRLVSPRGSTGIVGANNAGLNRHFERMSLKDENYRRQLRAFYSAVRNEGHLEILPGSRLNQLSLAQSAEHPGRRLIREPSIDGDEQGPPGSTVEPGWVWREALKASGGNPHRAMELIGFCGHDNVQQGSLLDRSDEGSRSIAYAEEWVKLEEGIASLVERGTWAKAVLGDGHYSVADQLAELRQRLSRLRLEQFDVRHERICPEPHSAFYLPGSLDKDADIDAKLKNRIAKAQAPTLGKEALPAKYYHVYGAAYTTCELIRKGMPAALAKALENRSAWAYRTWRLASDARRLASAREKYEAAFRQHLASLPKGARHPTEEEFRLEMSSRSLLTRRELTSMDAFTLMQRDGRILGSVPTGVALRPALGGLTKTLGNGIPAGWSKARYDAAAAKAWTFQVDWEWTVAQHKAGAEFAAKVCGREAR